MNLKGVHLVQKAGKYELEEVALKELLWKGADEHKVYGMYSEKTIIFMGDSWKGKSMFCDALAREFTVRKGDQKKIVCGATPFYPLLVVIPGTCWR